VLSRLLLTRADRYTNMTKFQNGVPGETGAAISPNPQPQDSGKKLYGTS